MHRSRALPLLPSIVGVILALNALMAPFGNTGVDGTLGAVLAAVGSAAATLIIIILLARPLPRGWFVALKAFAMIAALLTAIAAFFLMQTLLLLAMVATLLAMAIASVAQSWRSS